MCLFFVFISWHGASKTLGISRVMWVFCYSWAHRITSDFMLKSWLQKGDTPWFHWKKAWKLCVLDPPSHCPMCVFIWLVLICILYTKIVILNIAFLCSVIHSSELLNLKGSWEPPKFLSSWPEVQPECKVRAVLLEIRPFNLFFVCFNFYFILEYSWLTMLC